MKIRINDLARELEVKSKQILDVLIKVGVTEKKTHSSSVEADEAEKVRKHFHENSGAHARHRTGGEEFRPKIDLSKISKPGDALKAILARKEQPVEAAVVARPPAPPKVIVNKPAALRPPAPVVPERAPRFVTPESVAQRSQVSHVEPPRPAAVIVVPPAAVAAPVAETPVAVAPPETAAAPAASSPTQESAVSDATVVAAPVATGEAVATADGPSAAAPAKPAGHKPPHSGSARPTLSGQAVAPPARRMIVPQTGPRPVYLAPPPPPPRPPQPPSAMGNRTGLPVRGQPIFQRPRPGQSSGPAGVPGAPGSRPPFRPGERRPMHPTRTAPTPGGRPPMGGHPGMGTRPGGPPRPGGLGVAGAPTGPTPRPGARIGAPARRPGQRYQGPRGKQEGPMKGFTPPPRLSLSNEPMPITRAITISEGVSVKDLGDQL
jgi:translation initiation factor IF-2